MVTGLVTVNSNSDGLPKSREREEKTRQDRTPTANTQHDRENQEPGRRVITFPPSTTDQKLRPRDWAKSGPVLL